MDHDFFRTLFGSEEESDCLVQFCCPSQSPSAECQAEEPLPANAMLLGEPLPAHKLILRGGSEWFRGRMKPDHWVEKNGCGSKPVVTVSLNKAEEHPHALAALRFMYTGQLDAGADVATLLQVLRQAEYLGVQKCQDACKEALPNVIAAPAEVGQQQQQQQLGDALAGVVQLYIYRDLLSEAMPSFKDKMLRVCRKQLAAHAGTGQAVVTPGGSPSLGEVLAWAFEDAPFLLSNPEALARMRELSAAAMEALLGYNEFATDSESTVFLVLMQWLAVNSVDDDVRQRLLKLVRMCQLSADYLLRMLPRMPQRLITPKELRFLQDFAHADGAKKEKMRGYEQRGYDMTSGWYQDEPRPRLTLSRTYEWSMDAAQLRAWLGSGPSANLRVNGTFCNGAKSVVGDGFEFRPMVQLRISAKDTMGLFLMCSAPAFPPRGFPASVFIRVPGPCRLVLYKWVGNGVHREEAWSTAYNPASYFHVGYGRGSFKAISLAVPGSSASGAVPTSPVAQRLAALEPYVKDGKLWGALEWLPGDQ
jgi:hypothetical protein